MRKLPIWLTFTTILRVAFMHLGVAWRLIWPWLLVLVPFAVSVYWFGISQTHSERGQILDILVSFGGAFVGLFLCGIGVSSVAVGWHRYALLGEEPHGFGVLRIQSNVWSYLWNFIGISLLMVLVFVLPISILAYFLYLPLGLTGILASYSSQVMMALSAIPIACYLLCSPIITRFYLKLVGIALCDQTASFDTVSSASTGNYVGLLGLAVLLWTMSYVPNAGMDYLSEIIGQSGLVGFAFSTLRTVFQSMVIYVDIVSLTILYGFFVLGREIDALGRH